MCGFFLVLCFEFGDVFVSQRYAFREFVCFAVHFDFAIGFQCSRNSVSVAFGYKPFSFYSSCVEEVDDAFGSSLAEGVIGYSQKRTGIGVRCQFYDVSRVVYEYYEQVGKRVLILILQIPFCKIVSYLG